MKNIRIGNDIKIAWSLFNEGVAFPLEGLNLHVYLKDKFGRREIDDILISGNKIEWTFYGREQRRTGVYSLELVINEGEDGMITTDACQFVNLVACTCKISGADDKGVRTETIQLTSTLEYGAGGGNTDVKEELARLEREKADKSELTELSAEVSGLSEKIENLPSAESDVFKAIYGVTTYEEVSEAYNQGKIIHCDYESRCYELAVFTGNIAWFSCLNTTTSFLLMLNADSSWSKASYGLENVGNRVDTIKADAKTYQYPSAKAVYDFVNNTLGTIINGDY